MARTSIRALVFTSLAFVLIGVGFFLNAVTQKEAVPEEFVRTLADRMKDHVVRPSSNTDPNALSPGVQRAIKDSEKDPTLITPQQVLNDLSQSVAGLRIPNAQALQITQLVAPYQDPSVKPSNILVSSDSVSLLIGFTKYYIDDHTREETRKFWLATGVTILLLPIALWVILSVKFTPEAKVWAYAAAGLVAGFWLKT